MPFPADLPLPSHIQRKRQLRLKELTGASLRAMALRAGVVALEMAGFWSYASDSLLYDALCSCADLLSSLLLLLCLRAARSCPDTNHPFGHGRIEPLAGFILSALLLPLGGRLAWQQLTLLAAERSAPIDPRAGLFALAAASLMELSYRLTYRRAQRHHSPALLAEAMHYRLDGINSAIACLALAAAAVWPYQAPLFDHLGALLIALTMLYFGYKGSRVNLDQLLDRRPSHELFERIGSAARQTPGVLGTEKIRIQHYGPDAHVDIDIELDPQMSVEQAHEISQRVRRAIQSAWPAVLDVTVHIEPFFPGDHPEQ